ncbi:hypothetical protein HNR12_003243 [Streptomonospora nanhaiensis]|uniref:Uncharacterized protein n=1 Tax=Streptomonospora nanhaiensis TaxID=1323731 RepID=A0A853BQM1_9ACTN|nr:hypothetical protein [Streptomonospora nanhaiensis]NYI96966.1 hypothetical protein [Streptomonospora nanhaiensis]
MLPDPHGDLDLHRLHSRLAHIGTSWRVLERAIRMGEAGWRQATPNHSAGAAGRFGYEARLSALREGQKSEFGWDNARLMQIDLTVNPERTTAIQTMLGNSATGHPAETPRNLHPRGPNGQVLLAQGGGDQLALFDAEPLRAPGDEVQLDGADHPEVWVLLVNRMTRPGDDTVYWHSELSLPRPTNEQGYITDWIERLPLPVVAAGPVVFPDEGEVPGGLVIPVDFR